MGNFYRRRGKRTVDIVGASLGLVLTVPVQLAAAALVRWKLGPPVFFKQQRPGLGGSTFTLMKFRTMTIHQGPSGLLSTDAERLNTFGRKLRASSLDELPELWNVFRGEMSLIGPRPLLVEYLTRYSPEQARRHEVRPGITGWAQVNGRNALTWEHKFEMDVWYVDNLSLRLDARILWLTIAAVCSGRGVTTEGHATAEEFNPQV